MNQAKLYYMMLKLNIKYNKDKGIPLYKMKRFHIKNNNIYDRKVSDYETIIY
jgi:hypothetical protein